MKRILICVLLMIMIGYGLIVNGPRVGEDNSIDDVEVRSIFISYIELSKYLNGKSENVAIDNIKMMINNVKELGFNEVIVQARSFADAIYESEIFPWSRMVSEKEGVPLTYDVLQTFIDVGHDNGISIIAWINPYRIRNSEDVSDISSISPAYRYLNSDVVYVNNGVYFNPSKKETRNLIVSGVEEIVKRYDVDGILFDDYFYPNNEIDREDYEKYIKENGYISKAEYNLGVVSEVIKVVYDVCHKYGVKFGVSPDGNIENNYNKVFADVKKWCSEAGYIDFIMPQVYYGFYNETKAFKKVVDEWESIVTNDNIKMRIALAFYKVGEEDKWAKSGINEWMENDDVIMREIVLSRNLEKYEGFSLFRYDYIFNEELFTEMTINEIVNMKKVLN